MRWLTALLVFCTAQTGFCQSTASRNFLSDAAPSKHHYWVYFTDKGAPSQARPISARALARRHRLLGAAELTEADRPVAAEYLAKLRGMGATICTPLRWQNIVSVDCSDRTLGLIRLLPFVTGVTIARSQSSQLRRRDTLVIRDTLCAEHPFDSLYGPNRFALRAIHVPELHRMGIDATGVTIGFADTGFRPSIAALATRKITHAHDYVFGDDTVSNESVDLPGQDSHGTAVLTLATGFDPDSNIGPAYNAEILLAKTEDLRSESPREEENYAKALEDFEALGVDIFSSSLGYFAFDSGYVSHTYADLDGRTTISARAAAEAARRGVLVVTAAGNSGTTENPFIMSPGDADSIITVGAVSPNDTIAAFSSRGPTADGRIKPDITAPGTDLFVPAVDGSHYFGGGTSFATPLVAGAAALIMQAHPEADAQSVRRAIIRTGDHFDAPDSANGYGLLNAFAAAKNLGVFIGPPRIIETWDSLFLCVAVASNNRISSAWIEYGLDGDASLNRFLGLRPESRAEDSGFYSAGISRSDVGLRFIVRILESKADTVTTFPRTAPNYRVPLAKSGVVQNKPVNWLHLFPNPAVGRVTVVLPQSNGTGSVAVIDDRGIVVMSLSSFRAQGDITLDIGALPSGRYTVTYRGAEIFGEAPMVIWR